MSKICPVCSKSVFFAEKQVYNNKDYHKSCFRCTNEKCKKTLTAGKITEHLGQIYCEPCYKTNFGAHGLHGKV